MKIEFNQPAPRREDWRVTLEGRTVGDIWRCGEGYRVSVATLQAVSTKAEAFKAARKQLRGLHLSGA